MMKQGSRRAHQERCCDEIHCAYRGGDDGSADQILAGITADEELQRQMEAQVALASDAAAHGDVVPVVEGLEIGDRDDDAPPAGEAAAEAAG
jgi:hypothetical protein